MALPPLSNPPIVEVVCGVAFEALPELDPILLGTYWSQRRDQFPQRQLRPALHDQPSFVVGGVGPVRSWFVSGDDVFIIQIQPDRFYFNWRKRDDAYPRFNDGGEQQGILTRFLEELQRFSDFCAESVGRRPAPTRIETTKIDHLVEGLHWEGLGDLATVVPWLAVFESFSTTKDPAVGLRFNEQREEARLLVALDTATRNDEAGQTRLLKLESQIVKALGAEDDLREVFRWANNELNGVFERMIAPDALRRFGLGEA
jgi:uncharacterized protein (TIGR04255 family)